MTQQTLTTAIKSKMEAKGITPYRLSKLTGVSQSSLSLWFSGKRSISMDAFLKIGTVLELEINDTSLCAQCKTQKPEYCYDCMADNASELNS